ncbi:S8 family serine peptidase, partial [bacterium]|nr:S8 family serine peptidase [bacterium]
MVRLSQWLLRSPKPTRTAPRPRFRAEFLEDRLVPAGAVTTQGDAAILADQVRQLLGLDGSGVTIGVISDSFNLLGGAAADVASGDLPGVGVLSEGGPGGRDEGRAMLQIIHDIAPGATLLFASAGVSQVQLAASIRALANAGADIIVDDVTFPAEPMFQDGVVAQAVDQCAAAGIVYFSAAGNLGRQSYQSAFVNSGVNLGTSAGGAVTTVADFFAHDFDGGPGEDLYQTVTLPAGRTTFSFQWADRYASAGGPGAETDMDLALFDENGVFLSMIGGFSTNVGGDPVEVFEVDAGAGGTYQIALGKVSGPDPALVKYVAFADGFKIDEYDTQSSTVFGHANAAGAIAVGAARYSDTPRFGAAPPAARAFTGRGGTPILFDTAGNPLPSSTRPSPLVVAPDGVNTTFFGSDDEPDGFPNFVGTSASAPHAAAVAALMLHANRGLTPAQVADVLAGTALDIGPAGVDVDTGAGLIQALPAVLSVGSHFDVTLDGTDGDDTYRVRRDSSG